VRGRGHLHLGPERRAGLLDPDVVRRDDHLGGAGCHDAFVDMLDHRSAADIRQRLARQPG